MAESNFPDGCRERDGGSLLYDRCRATCFDGGCSGNWLSTVCNGRVELNIKVLLQTVN